MYNYGNYGITGMVPNAVQGPKTRSWLTPEEIALLQKNSNQFSLSVTTEDKLKGQCNHYYYETGASALIPDADGSGSYTCAICGTHFSTNEFSQEDVENSVHNILDILNTIKITYWSLNPAAANDYFQIIPLIEKIPALYKIAMDDFKKHEGVSTFNPVQQQNPFNLYSMMTNPIAYYPQGQGYYQPPQVAGYPQYQQPVDPQYQQPQQPGYNPLYGAPMTPQYPQQPAPQYQPQQPGYNFNPQGAAASTVPTVNTNMPVQPTVGVPAPAASAPASPVEPPKVDMQFKK